MRFKQIICIGTTVIITVVIIFILMYYYNQDVCPEGTYFCLYSVSCLPQPSWCNEIVSCPRDDDWNFIDCYNCPAETFNCPNSNVCLPYHRWCDGNYDCPNGEDENSQNCYDSNDWELLFTTPRKSLNRVCKPSDCPKEKCKCKNCVVTCEGYSIFPHDLSPNITTITLNNNSLESITTNDFTGYKKITNLFLKYNNIKSIQNGSFAGLSYLQWLVLSHNKLKEILPGHFFGLKSLETFLANSNQLISVDFYDFENSKTLEWIDLSDNNLTFDNLIFYYQPALKDLVLNQNKIKKITNSFLLNFPNLKSLSLEKNYLYTISSDVFKNVNYLIELNLSYNKLKKLPMDLFNSVNYLTALMIAYNPIENLSTTIFHPARELTTLDLRDIDIENNARNAFNRFNKLSTINFKKFSYCQIYAPTVERCRPASDGVSSLSDLLSKPLLRVAVWGISVVTILGNTLVLCGRFICKNENRVLSIVIKNLAIADMLMGVYLMAIGLVDFNLRDMYNKSANKWMSSWQCTFLGMIAMVSCEVSVLILSFMSVERFIVIVAPINEARRYFTCRGATTSMIIIWIIGVLLSLIPVIYWRNSTRFYGLNGMCFSLHIDEAFTIGWQYSAFIFLGVNLLSLITIGSVYLGMFISIWRTRHNTPLSLGDSEIALRFFFIVLTDAACWAPVILFKILALVNYPVAPDLQAWVVVFILPVNGAVNPILYTFIAPKFKERFIEGCCGRI